MPARLPRLDPRLQRGDCSPVAARWRTSAESRRPRSAHSAFARGRAISRPPIVAESRDRRARQRGEGKWKRGRPPASRYPSRFPFPRRRRTRRYRQSRPRRRCRRRCPRQSRSAAGKGDHRERGRRDGRHLGADAEGDVRRDVSLVVPGDGAGRRIGIEEDRDLGQSAQCGVELRERRRRSRRERDGPRAERIEVADGCGVGAGREQQRD
jgi:hypothetical protein